MAISEDGSGSAEETRPARARIPVIAALVLCVALFGATAWIVLSVHPLEVAEPTTPSPAAASRATPTVAPVVPAVAQVSDRPEFDIVRVTPLGQTVAAGRAAPDSLVVISSNGRELGRTKADSNGQWTILPNDPLKPGLQTLTLSAQMADGTMLTGTTPVVIVVPGVPPPEADAETTLASKMPPRSPDAFDTPLVVATPLDGPAVVLQGPQADQPPASVPRTMPPQPTASASPGAAPPVPRSGVQAPTPTTTALGATPLLPPITPPNGTRTRRVSLDTLDYDETGNVRFAGSGAPDADLRVYVDDRLIGDAHADSRGRWVLTPVQAVAEGDHSVRVDQLAADGRVSARVELPFHRTAVEAIDLSAGHLVVQPGQNLWRIARKAYGQGIRYTIIYAANREQIRNPNRIYPGQVFAIPPRTGAHSTAARSVSSR